jgi:hypothetical protein
MGVDEERSSMNMDIDQTIKASHPPGDQQLIFTILNTPVKVQPGFFANLLALWAAMSWQAAPPAALMLAWV